MPILCAAGLQRCLAPLAFTLSLVATPTIQADIHRFHHSPYQARAGLAFSSLPYGSVRVGFRGANYFYHRGVWLRPFGPRFVVTLPPVGIVVPQLPPTYATVWVGSHPYYSRVPEQGYVVVPAPAEPVMAHPPAPPQPQVTSPVPPQEWILYPRNGQTVQQTQSDRQECMQWASAQSHASDPAVFQRALAACLDGRGYSAR